ncbi:hypothetical protein [Streptomyces sp. NBC_01304]|uniref:hypothetical protein n=1 Tax=Streptomyces sp. NBC_01304 TaxID=2903818 RepID=UPI002E0EAAA4|nr:hypothetical protein OG430_47700 [Streptomyces sp. NBC_01304]
MYNDGETKVAVDVRALSVDGYTNLRDVARDSLLRLAEPVLGMKAGLWRAGWSYGYGDYPCSVRELVRVDPDQAAELLAEDTPVHAASRASDWTSDFPVLIQGLTVGELRTVLATVDLPDATLVAIKSADHPREFASSPASTRVEVGFYMPAPESGMYGMASSGGPDYDEDWNIPAHVPALVLYPTH